MSGKTRRETNMTKFVIRGGEGGAPLLTDISIP